MDAIASSFTLRKNAKRVAETMIRKGTAPAVEYSLSPVTMGGLRSSGKIANTARTTDQVETKVAPASADQPAIALPTEGARRPAPAATQPATTDDAMPQLVSEAEAASKPEPVASEPAPAASEPDGSLARERWFADSPVEEAGFELLVPRKAPAPSPALPQVRADYFSLPEIGLRRP